LTLPFALNIILANVKLWKRMRDLNMKLWDEIKDEMSIRFQLDSKIFILNEGDLYEALSVPFEDEMYLKVDWERDITQTKFETQLCGAPQLTMMASQIQHLALKYVQ
jgi:pyridoxal biosynthesis lyase PdxS